MIAGILVGAARASDDVATATPTTARQGLLAATDTAENDAGSNDWEPTTAGPRPT